ncbi:MAG: hypothetical protein NTV89_03655, partial [Proteobacteria bacterium]|nr:hypothetical protein [Pseudomonadota bacterium]
MHTKTFTAIFYSVVIATLLCFISSGDGLCIEVLDFTGITITDNMGVPATEFGPGNIVKIEAAYSLSRAGIAWLRGTVIGTNWSAELPLRVRVGLKGDYKAAWAVTIPVTAT